MTIIEQMAQTRAFARIDGVWLAAWWLAAMAATLYCGQAFWGQLLTLATPAVMVWIVVRFRDKVLGGAIGFARAWAYVTYTVFYAAVLTAAVQYAYFALIDGGRVAMMLTEAWAELAPVYKQAGVDTSAMEQSLQKLVQLRPIEWVFTLMVQHLLLGTLVSVVVAAIAVRRAGSRRNG